MILLIVAGIFALCLNRKALLFLMSFTPLFWILFVKVFLEFIYEKKVPEKSVGTLIPAYLNRMFESYFWVAIILLGIIPWIAWIFTIHKTNKSTTSLEVVRVEKMGDNIVSYVMTYIVPLTSLSYSSSVSEYTSNVLLFILIMVLYIRLDLVYLNPILIILGWNTYHVIEANSDSFLLTKAKYSMITSVTKSDSTNNVCNLKVSKLSNNLYIYTRKRECYIDDER